MDENTKAVALSALALLGSLGAAYIAARWHIGISQTKADNQALAKSEKPPVDVGKVQ